MRAGQATAPGLRAITREPRRPTYSSTKPRESTYVTNQNTNAEHYPGETRDLTRNLADSGQIFGLDEATRADAEAAYKSGNLPLMRDASAAVTDWLRLNGGPDDFEI